MIQTNKIFSNQWFTHSTASQLRKLSHLPRGVDSFVNLLLERYGSEVLTPEASDVCDIRNIPDLVKKSRDRLALLGLSVEMTMVYRPNKFGEYRRIGSWRLTVVDHALWFGVEAVNDAG